MKEAKKPKSSASKPTFAKEAISDFDNAVQMAIDSLQELIMMTAVGFGELIHLTYRHYVISISSLAAIFFATRYFAKNAYHVEFLASGMPDFFTSERLEWFYQFTLNQHHFTIFSVTLAFVCFLLGISLRFTRTKFNRIFLTAGLSNGEGDTPKLVCRRKLDRYRTEYEFDANGIGISEFEDKRERIEARFKMEIESIKYGKHQGRILITFNKKKFPEKITYQEVSESKVLPPDSFYVGESMEGIITQNASEMPHMLITGSTGSGKSVFFKQCLLGLLESSHHIQMYLIDLKGGLEMIDFAPAPNVKVVKTMKDAVAVLRQVESEMMSRFKYLEQKGFKHIVPERDKKERIIVACDEASVLYMNRSKFDPDYHYALEARKYADSISKLSRAASISLLLATQKLDKAVLPTSVSENISARVVFRANSLQGSMVALGSKDAYELPHIPGRAIWRLGNRQAIVQAPYIGENHIKHTCKLLQNEFKAKKRALFNPMVGEEERSKTKLKQRSIKEKLIKGKNDETKRN